MVIIFPGQDGVAAPPAAPPDVGQLEGWDVLFPVDWTNHGLATTRTYQPDLPRSLITITRLQVTLLNTK